MNDYSPEEVAQSVDSDVYKKIDRLTAKEITATVRGVVSVNREERQQKQSLILAVLKQADTEMLDLLVRASEQKEADNKLRRQGRKRKRDEDDKDDEVLESNKYKRISQLTLEEIVASVGSTVIFDRKECFRK
jgi:hypothetical protein